MAETAGNHLCDQSPAAVRLRVPERSQVEMKFESVDDLVKADHPVRVVWRVVETLDLSAFCEPIKARAGSGGRDATDPRLLVALWLYGCIRGIGSARELARRCDPEEGSRAFLWLCGGVSVNHHLLSDFRVEHAAALDRLFTNTIAVLVKQGLVKVTRIAQDGTRVRASAGASSFRRAASTLACLQQEAAAQVEALKRLLEDSRASAGLSARQRAARERAARERAARERAARIGKAIEQIPQLQQRQDRLAKRMSKKQKETKLKEPRVSTSDDEARAMKMPNGGFNPAVNVQLAVDTDSRAIVGVDVTNAGADSDQAEKMRQQVEERTGQKVSQHLMDGGFLVHDQIERAAAQGVLLFVPPKPPRKREKYGSQYQPRAKDSQAINDWRVRMGTTEAKEIYKQRAATVETANAHLKEHGMRSMLVRGLTKTKCVALWCALAYNVMMFARHLVG
jgi:transposase